MPTAYLSLGSNLDPVRHLREAIDALRERFGEVEVSAVYRFPAVGYAGADFLNAAAAIRTDLSPEALNAWLHALEDAHGRDRSGPRYSDRTLDIDIVLYDDLVAEGTGNLRQRLEHEGVAQFVARDAQISRALGDEVVVQHDVDVERAVAVARPAAVATVRVLQRMQPGVERLR